MRFYPEHLVVDEAMSSDITSQSLQLKQHWGACVSCVVTAGSSPSGTLYVQASVDNVNYANMTGMSQAVSADGTFIFDIVNTNAQYIRVFYDRTSGSGVLNVKTYAKGF